MEEQSAQRTRNGKKKKKKRVRGSSLMLERIADSRPGTAGEGEEYIPSSMPVKTSNESPLSKGELSAQDLFAGNKSDDTDIEGDDESERKIRTPKKSGAQRRRERWNRVLEEKDKSPESPSMRTSKMSSTLK